MYKSDVPVTPIAPSTLPFVIGTRVFFDSAMNTIAPNSDRKPLTVIEFHALHLPSTPPKLQQIAPSATSSAPFALLFIYFPAPCISPHTFFSISFIRFSGSPSTHISFATAASLVMSRALNTRSESTFRPTS